MDRLDGHAAPTLAAAPDRLGFCGPGYDRTVPGRGSAPARPAKGDSMALPLRPQGSRVRLLVLGLLAAVTLVGLLPGSGRAGPAAPTFAAPVYVDQQLAGGEPEVFADTLHGRLIYSAHEGTTHLYRDGIVNSPWGDFSFVSNYCNQVNIWTSPDGGANWYRDRYLGTPCPTSPAINTGFSDPDLTQDAGGRVYNTGIDLVNDALFSSTDGGRSWTQGTVNCSEGDRPWLAGAKKDEVFLATNTVTDGHMVFRSTDGGQSCPANGIPDSGDNYQGNGKLLYDRTRD